MPAIFCRSVKKPGRRRVKAGGRNEGVERSGHDGLESCWPGREWPRPPCHARRDVRRGNLDNRADDEDEDQVAREARARERHVPRCPPASTPQAGADDEERERDFPIMSTFSPAEMLETRTPGRSYSAPSRATWRAQADSSGNSASTTAMTPGPCVCHSSDRG